MQPLLSAGEPRPLTISQVKKAGRTLRHAMRGQVNHHEDVMAAYDLLLRYRAAHAAPLGKATMGLRSMVKTEGCVVEVSQRLKRVPTILDKLSRESTLPLSSMQDIAGCRAVLKSIDEVRRVEARLKRNRPPVAVSDYITAPRESGYRGVHVVVSYDHRNVEVQLRSRVMHEWAITVERLSGRIGQNLKQDGQHAVQELMRVISEAMAIEEQGGSVDDSLLRDLAQRRAAARPYLEGTAH
jgi:putative GTP pyrophosphokinase